MIWSLRWPVLGALLLLAGCAQEKPSDPQNPRVSTIPWNRPEKWEGQGMLGGFSGSH